MGQRPPWTKGAIRKQSPSRVAAGWTSIKGPVDEAIPPYPHWTDRLWPAPRGRLHPAPAQRAASLGAGTATHGNGDAYRNGNGYTSANRGSDRDSDANTDCYRDGHTLAHQHPVRPGVESHRDQRRR